MRGRRIFHVCLCDGVIRRNTARFVVHVPHEVPHANNYPFDYPERYGFALAVDLATVTDLHYQNKEARILDLMEDPVVSDSKAGDMLLPLQFLHSRRTWFDF